MRASITTSKAEIRSLVTISRRSPRSYMSRTLPRLYSGRPRSVPPTSGGSGAPGASDGSQLTPGPHVRTRYHGAAPAAVRSLRLPQPEAFEGGIDRPQVVLMIEQRREVLFAEQRADARVGPQQRLEVRLVVPRLLGVALH